jgi:alkylation response protein AidB-like acyl-CoA dehydrogenase
VDFELSDDQQALQEAARDLLDGQSSPAQVRAHLASGQPYDAKLWTAMVEQGWMGVTLPESAGGLGLSWVEAAVLCEEVGRHTAPAPFLPSLLALDTLARAGGDTGTETAGGAHEAQAWVEPLLNGTAIGCVAWSRDPGAVTVNADGTLSGRPDPVVAAADADVAVLWTPAEVFAVDLTAGGRPDRQPSVDETSTLAWLPFDHSPATRIGGRDAAAALLDRGAVATSAQLLGGAGRILELTAAYAKDRVQFGQPIGSFQAVKHRCADMVVDVEGMRSTAWYGAWCLSSAPPDESHVAASAAKVWCADAAKRVMASGLQVHGGIGFTWEHDLHLFLKRAQLDQLTFGDAVFHRERLAGLLRARVERGASVI